MTKNPQPQDSSVLDGLSAIARERLRAIDVMYDSQLPGLDLDALELPPKDTSTLRAAVAAMPACEEVDVRPLVGGITPEQVDPDPKEDDDERV